MKLMIALLALAAAPALAAPPIASNLNLEIPGVKDRYAGLKNVKMVMPGVLYRGGGLGGKEPIGSAQLEALCEDGFTSAVYSYRTGWQGEQRVSCGAGSLQYDYRQWDKEAGGKAMLASIHKIIQNGQGALYVHCWHGVHASGYLAAIALMQFCDYLPEQAVQYWNENVPASIRYQKVQDKIRAFRPYKEFQISGAEQTRVCPN
jgi:hypothetical protein